MQKLLLRTAFALALAGAAILRADEPYRHGGRTPERSVVKGFFAGGGRLYRLANRRVGQLPGPGRGSP